MRHRSDLVSIDSRILPPHFLQQLKAALVVEKTRILLDIQTTLPDDINVPLFDAFRAGDKKGPKEIHIALDELDVLKTLPDPALDVAIRT